MARFILDTDYDVIIREEIKEFLIEFSGDEADPGDDTIKLFRSEDMAIAQIKNFLAGRYDVAKIFQTDIPEDRNAHIVMITIDISLYHLYSSQSPDKIPSHRSDRYQDALNWLKDVARGNITADLPAITDEDGTEKFPFRIKSERKNEDNRW